MLSADEAQCVYLLYSAVQLFMKAVLLHFLWKASFLSAVSCITTLLLQRALCFDNWLWSLARFCVRDTKHVHVCLSVLHTLYSSIKFECLLCVFCVTANNRFGYHSSDPGESEPVKVQCLFSAYVTCQHPQLLWPLAAQAFKQVPQNYKSSLELEEIKEG